MEATQITGINNAGEITGSYTDANGVAHGFVAMASVPEPGSVELLGVGFAAPSHTHIAAHGNRRSTRVSVRSVLSHLFALDASGGPSASPLNAGLNVAYSCAVVRCYLQMNNARRVTMRKRRFDRTPE